jgi:hypothetical protein
MTDPRAALAEADLRICRLHMRVQDDPGHEYRYPDCENAGFIDLAERDVRLVTREQIRAAVYKAAENPAHDWHPREEQADDVWAALSGEATE